MDPSIRRRVCRAGRVLGWLLVAALAQVRASADEREISATLDRADALSATDPAKSLEMATSAAAMLGSTPNRDLDIRALSIMADACTGLGRGEDALSYADRGLTLIGPTANPGLRARLLLSKGKALGFLGRYDESVPILDQAVDLARTIGDRSTCADALIARGTKEAFTSEEDLALKDLTEAHAIAEELGDERMLAEALGALAYLYDALGNYTEALSFLEQALVLFEKMRNEQSTAVSLFNMARIYRGLKKPDRAVEFYERSMVLSRKVGDDSGVAYALHGLGAIERERGHLPEALRRQKAALASFEKLGDQAMIFAALVEIGRVERASGALTASLQSLQQALSVASGMKTKYEQMLVHREIGLTYASSKDFTKAYEHAVESTDLKDRVFNEQRDKQVQELRLRFGTKLKEKENRLLTKENELQSLRLASERRLKTLYFWLSVAATVIAVFLAHAVYRHILTKRRLAALATTDELTGLPNRRRIMAAAEEEFRRARRYAFPLCVAVIDLDLYKQINDRFGHAAGDEVLRRFGETCQKICREEDRIGRVGGDEFMGLFPHTDLDGALTVLERLRASVEALEIDVLRGERRVTASIGISAASESDAVMDDVIRRADRALYQAKSTGRNRFCVAQE